MDYNLIIDNMRKIVTSGSLSDVVVSIDYAIACTGSNNGTSSYHLEASVCTLGTVASSSFIAYNNLTEGTVSTGNALGDFNVYNYTFVAQEVSPPNFLVVDTTSANFPVSNMAGLSGTITIGTPATV